MHESCLTAFQLENLIRDRLKEAKTRQFSRVRNNHISLLTPVIAQINSNSLLEYEKIAQT